MDQIKTGKFIAALRKEDGLTRQALGDALGVTDKTVSGWETGADTPDVEMLGLLSERFKVSMQELLCGRRLNDADFGKTADESIVSAGRLSTFSVREKTAFWRRKWLREHTALLAVCILAWAGLLVFAWLRHMAWLVGTAALLWPVGYALLRNKMMSYIETRVYGQGENAHK